MESTAKIVMLGIVCSVAVLSSIGVFLPSFAQTDNATSMMTGNMTGNMTWDDTNSSGQISGRGK